MTPTHGKKRKKIVFFPVSTRGGGGGYQNDAKSPSKQFINNPLRQDFDHLLQ